MTSSTLLDVYNETVSCPPCYFRCVDAATCGAESVQNKAAVSNVLDNAPASYGGALIQFASGEYFYMCSRNNNFTNRSQKGRLSVK